jgi:hypothetical protein
MNIIGYYFSSLLNMLAFTSNENDVKESIKEEETENSNEKEEKSEEKEEKSEETFTFIDVFEKENEEFNDMVHEIFLTNF